MLDWVKRKSFMVRWGSIARKWPVDRLLPTIDLDLTEDQKEELDLGIHGWRQLVPHYIERFNGLKADAQVYCFGVAHGSTVYGLARGFRGRNMEIPHLHLFDSFQGLPAEDSDIAKPPIWSVGAFSAPRKKLEDKLRSLDLDAATYSIHEGWFSDTLKTSLVRRGTFKPAAYVDIDADLYNSTRDVLDFMFAEGLIQPGTLIGYDDWGDTDLWTAGESRAHKEIMQKYGARCAQLLSWGEPPLIKKLFLVVQIEAREGPAMSEAGAITAM